MMSIQPNPINLTELAFFSLVSFSFCVKVNDLKQWKCWIKGESTQSLALKEIPHCTQTIYLSVDSQNLSLLSWLTHLYSSIPTFLFYDRPAEDETGPRLSKLTGRIGLPLWRLQNKDFTYSIKGKIGATTFLMIRVHFFKWYWLRIPILNTPSSKSADPLAMPWGVSTLAQQWKSQLKLQERLIPSMMEDTRRTPAPTKTLYSTPR